MALQTFRSKSFNAKSLGLIESCNEVIDEYLEQGLSLTLRQLYYQLVTKNIIENKEQSYKNLSSLVSDARLAGKMDWGAIEDRGRQPTVPSEFEDLPTLVDVALSSYRLPRWKGQNSYVELWVEKDALSGVLRPVAHKHHIVLAVNKGYSSQSAMYEASKRFIDECDSGEIKDPVLLYFGDHDPSGEDMVRDIRERLEMYGVENIDVRKIALTMEQIEKYNPPPNPAKVTDPRAAAYIEKYGDNSWELDALKPEILVSLINKAILELVDMAKMKKIIAQEELDKKELTKAVELIMKKRK